MKKLISLVLIISLESSTSIALVYDRIGCYAYNGETIQLIFTNEKALVKMDYWNA